MLPHLIPIRKQREIGIEAVIVEDKTSILFSSISSFENVILIIPYNQQKKPTKKNKISSKFSLVFIIKVILKVMILYSP